MMKYIILMTLSIALLYIYNTFIPKNVMTFIVGLPIFVGIILLVASRFETRCDLP